MKPDLYIARRYLVAKKSLGVIHVISTISAVGMVIGTAALILILSIYDSEQIQARIDMLRQAGNSVTMMMLERGRRHEASREKTA